MIYFQRCMFFIFHSLLTSFSSRFFVPTDLTNAAFSTLHASRNKGALTIRGSLLPGARSLKVVDYLCLGSPSLTTIAVVWIIKPSPFSFMSHKFSTFRRGCFTVPGVTAIMNIDWTLSVRWPSDSLTSWDLKRPSFAASNKSYAMKIPLISCLVIVLDKNWSLAVLHCWFSSYSPAFWRYK